MNVTLIHNPKAGDETHRDADGLMKLIRKAGHKATYTSSKDKSWEAALDEPTDLVAVAGGDGTVGKVARHMVGHQAPFTILPTGTANNVAKTLGLTGVPPGDLIAGWADGRRVRLDVGIATGPWRSRPFIEGFGLGLFAEIMSRLATKGTPERAQLKAGDDEVTCVREILEEQLRRHEPERVTVVLDGRDLSGEYVLLEVMNMNYIGPNLHLAPKADPGDGLLDLVLIPQADRKRLSEYLLRDPDGRPPGLTVHRGKSLRLEWRRSVAHIDDELLPGATGSAPNVTSVDLVIDPRDLLFLHPAR